MHMYASPIPLYTYISFLILLLANRCTSSDLDHVGYGTKTPYYLVNAPDKEFSEDDWYNVNTDKLTCGAIHVSTVIRHGARNPGEGDVRKISEIHVRLKDNIDKSKFKELIEWTNPFPRDNNKLLNDAGEQEQSQLGHRVAKRLKSLFLEEDMSAVKFTVSNTKRTESSAIAFNEGFSEQLDLPEEAIEDFDTEESNELLRAHSLCPHFQKTVENNKTALIEYDRFGATDHVSKTLQRVTEKLGVEKNVLEPDDLKTMLVICGSEMALFKKSPWCDLFDDEDLQVLNYWTDLKKYYKYGPGHHITSKLSCPLVAELFTVMDDTIAVMEKTEEDKDVEGYLIANFMFGHAETLSALYYTLSMYNDTEPLLAKNYEQHKNRHFRSTRLFPFSGNVIFILYECEENEELINDEEEYEELQEDYLLQVLVNEKPIVLPGCKEVLCPFSEVRAYYQDIIEDCNFDEECHPSHTTHDEL